MKHVPTVVVGIVVVGAAAFAACSKTPEPRPDPAAKTAEPSTPSTPTASASGAGMSTTTAAGPDDIGYDAPAAWTSMPNTNTMRKATFKIPKAAGDTEDAELTVSAAAGGVEQNVKRWSGQFGNAEPKTEQRTVNGLKITIVEIKGTFSSGGGPMMGGPSTPKEKQMLLGAIVDTGDRQHFFKMTGPEKTVTAARKDFDSFVSSFRAK